MSNIHFLRSIPPHVEALRLLVERCPNPEAKKSLIVTAGACEAVSPDEAFVMVTAYHLEDV